MICKHCGQPIETPAAAGERPLSLVARYRAVSRKQLARFLGVTVNATAKRCRRLIARGFLVQTSLPDASVYYELTPVGYRRLAMKACPKLASHEAVITQLSVAEFFALNAPHEERLFTLPELHAFSETLREAKRIELEVGDFERERFYVDSEDRLRQVIVHQGAGNGSIRSYASRLSGRIKRLKAKGEGWRELLAGGSFAYTVLSGTEANEQLQRALRRLKLSVPARLYHVPLLTRLGGF